MSKYGNVKTNGRASKKEARRAAELELLQRLGGISGLTEQVGFEIVPKQDGERAVTYIADFVYVDETGQIVERDANGRVVEDSKGFRTPDYIIKRKLMKHVHGITIREV